MKNTQKNLSHKLETNGFVLVDQLETPLRDSEWKSLDIFTSTDNLMYKRSIKGDTDEKASVSYFRIKIANDNCYYSPEIMDILETDKFKFFLENMTGLKSLKIDRCQSHLYYEGDFLEYHNDQDSTPRYLYTILMYLSDEYHGGEFSIKKEGENHDFHPKKYSILFSKSHLEHGVKKVMSGERKVVVFFLQSEDNLKKAR